jgi:hypothetical protein
VRAALPEMPSSAVLLWLALFCIVSFQVTTFMRPDAVARTERAGVQARQAVLS